VGRDSRLGRAEEAEKGRRRGDPKWIYGYNNTRFRKISDHYQNTYQDFDRRPGEIPTLRLFSRNYRWDFWVKGGSGLFPVQKNTQNVA